MRVLLSVVLIFVSLNAAYPEDVRWPEPDTAFFTKLRMDYAKRPDFNPAWNFDDEHEAILKASNAKDFAKVIELSKAWLAKCPVDADIHYLYSRTLSLQGDIVHYADQQYYYHGLIASIASSGDGLTEKTGFKVISVSEEYYLLRDFNATLVSQSLQGNCDVMRCKLRDGKEVTYYFDAAIALAAEAKAVSGKK